MTLYLYKTGEKAPLLTLEHAATYTADSVTMEDGGVYAPLAEGFELSSLPDCSETLRAVWRKENPTPEQRVEELEELMASLLFGGEGV